MMNATCTRSESAALFGSASDQRIAVDMNFFEYFAVQLIQLAHAFERVVEPRQCAVAFIPLHGTREKVT